MKQLCLKALVLILILIISVNHITAQQTMAPNPIITDIYTADPSAHVWKDGRLYLYPSHDVAPPRGCDLMDQYHVYSTDDMVHWTDHGEILRASQVPWGRPEGGFMWAPDCAFKNGTYYYYFPHPTGAGDLWNSTWKIGVATSKSPAGGFTVQGYIPGLESLIDPCVFIDDDSTAYFYQGGGGRCLGGKLKDNMMEIDGTMKPMMGLTDFHEGTWVHKRNGIYYLSYPDNTNPGGNQMRYATSNSPLGPWTSRGIYMEQTGCETNHGSIVEFKGQWYAFYHNSILSGNGNLRSVCVDKLFYNEDGSIQMVKQTREHGTPYKGITRQVPGVIEAEDYNEGGQGKGYSDSDPSNTQGKYRLNEGVDIESYSAGSYSIGNTNDGEFTNYTVEVTADGIYDVQCVVASGVTNGGGFHLEIDDRKVTGKLAVPNKGWATWQTITAGIIPLTKGVHVFKFFTYGGMNVDKFKFVEGMHAYFTDPIQVPGTFQAEHFDKGGEGVSYHDTEAANKTAAFRTGEGVDIENCAEGGFNISWMQGGEWLGYTIRVAKTDEYDIITRAAADGGGSFHIEIDDH
ncbi:MAG TPA: family 43 glycosylhydrolase, partial [Prolixibacteraceae bacterium]|nr:family 43 glycosylhydrolase [Prolixibacteraceae bacterium]